MVETHFSKAISPFKNIGSIFKSNSNFILEKPEINNVQSLEPNIYEHNQSLSIEPDLKENLVSVEIPFTCSLDSLEPQHALNQLEETRNCISNIVLSLTAN